LIGTNGENLPLFHCLQFIYIKGLTVIAVDFVYSLSIIKTRGQFLLDLLGHLY